MEKMQDFERAYRGAGASDKMDACVYRPPKKEQPPPPPPPHPRRRRGSSVGALSSSSYSSSSDPAPWVSRESDAKRRRRVASYKAYGVGSKLKDAVRRGLRWIKVRCSGLVQSR